MKILAIDSSGTVASVALLEDEILRAECTVNNRLTHSQTLMPMLEQALSMAQWDITEVDVVAVAAGPGSFTGLRIGSASAKGLAFALGKPIAQISTLEAMAYGVYGYEGLICPMMDARRSQVYTGLYSFGSPGEGAGKGAALSLRCIMEPAALSVEEITAKINELGERTVLTGDGVSACRDAIGRFLEVEYTIAPPHVNRQRAASVGALAFEHASRGLLVSAAEHVPEYLRLSQAERERKKREEMITDGGQE